MTPAVRWSRERWVLAAALSTIAAQLAYRAWAVYGGWFHIDDFNFISWMFHDGLAPSVAARSYWGHVMPAAMYLTWLNQVIAPWDFWLPATEMLLLQLLGSLGLLHLLRTMFGLRPGILPPLALFLASVIPLEGSIWWAAAINLLPLQIALFFGLAAHLDYLRTGRLSKALLANLWILGGVVFNEKTALVYGVLGIVTLCYFATGRSPLARIRSALHGRWTGFALYAGTGAAYVAVYVLVGRGFSSADRKGYPVLDTISRMVYDTLIPGLMGGPVRWWRIPDGPFSFALPGDALALLAAALLAVLIWEIRRHRTRALRGLWIPLYFLAIDVALTLVTRASVSSALIGLDYRYQGELAAAAAIGLACMTMPIVGAAESSQRRSESEFLDHPRRIAVATIAMVAVAVWSTWGYVTYWHSDDRARQWFATLEPQLRAATTPIPMIDAVVPDFVTNGARYPENLQSRVLAGESSLAFTEIATDRINMIDDTGQIVAAAIPRTREARTGPHGKCGWKVESVPVAIALDGPVAYGGWWVRIGYLSSGDSAVRVSAGDVVRDTTIRAGVHALYVKAGPQFESVTVSGLDDGVTLCSNDVSVGRPVPSTALEEALEEEQTDPTTDPSSDPSTDTEQAE